MLHSLHPTGSTALPGTPTAPLRQIAGGGAHVSDTYRHLWREFSGGEGIATPTGTGCMRLFLATTVVLLLGAPPVAAQNPDEGAVMDVVQRLFDGMRTADSAQVRSVFHGDARLISTGQRNGEPAVGIIPIDGFVQAVGGAEVPWDERIYNPEVRIDGNLAQVWVEYTFHAGDRFSHCGIDSIQLARTPAGWKIVSLADTRRSTGCEALLEQEPWSPAG